MRRLRTEPLGRGGVAGLWPAVAMGLIVVGCTASPGPVASPSASAVGSDAPTASTTAETRLRGVVALGHSGLTGEGSDPSRPGQEARENSWATGTAPEVNSIYQRLIAVRPETDGHVANVAQAGAPASALLAQARNALEEVPAPELVIIQTIDGDIRCDGTDDAHVPEFGAAVSETLEVITEASPESRILMFGQAGRPAMEAEALADEPEIRRMFGGTGICDFFNPQGTLVPERLATLTGIIEQYEAEQARVCGMVPQCETDEGLLATHVREDDHLAPDGNHLGVRGLAAIAELIWPTVVDLLDLEVGTKGWIVY